MFNPLIHRGEVTLANGGNHHVRVDGSSFGGRMAGGGFRHGQRG
jgi:hypothetical protein